MTLNDSAAPLQKSRSLTRLPRNSRRTLFNNHHQGQSEEKAELIMQRHLCAIYSGAVNIACGSSSAIQKFPKDFSLSLS